MPNLTTGARRVARSVLVVVAVLAALLATSPTTAPPAAAFSTTSGVRLNAVEARLLTLINSARTSRGIAALRITPGTTDLARRWAAYQTKTNSLMHNPNVQTQLERAGSEAWMTYGENVGVGVDADGLFDAYMNSPGHRANILDRSFRFIGLGWVERPDGVGYNTQNFVDTYDWAYGPTRVPAFGGRADRRTYTSSGTFASFEHGRDQRAYTRVTRSGLAVSPLQVQTPGIGDQAGVFTVRQTAAGVGGAAQLLMRDAMDLSRARSLTTRVSATTGTGRALVVDVLLRLEFGTVVYLGSIRVPHGQTVTASLPLPLAARTARNELTLSVSRTSLTALNPGSLNGRSAKIAVRYIGVIV